jgi:hypothetical protein
MYELSTHYTRLDEDDNIYFNMKTNFIIILITFEQLLKYLISKKRVLNEQKLNINHENTLVEETKIFKYLGYQVDIRLSFKFREDGQLKNCHQT